MVTTWKTISVIFRWYACTEYLRRIASSQRKMRKISFSFCFLYFLSSLFSPSFLFFFFSVISKRGQVAKTVCAQFARTAASTTAKYSRSIDYQREGSVVSTLDPSLSSFQQPPTMEYGRRVIRTAEKLATAR